MTLKLNAIDMKHKNVKVLREEDFQKKMIELSLSNVRGE